MPEVESDDWNLDIMDELEKLDKDKLDEVDDLPMLATTY